MEDDHFISSQTRDLLDKVMPHNFALGRHISDRVVYDTSLFSVPYKEGLDLRQTIITTITLFQAVEQITDKTLANYNAFVGKEEKDERAIVC